MPSFLPYYDGGRGDAEWLTLQLRHSSPSPLLISRRHLSFYQSHSPRLSPCPWLLIPLIIARRPACCTQGSSQRGPRSFMRRPKGQIPSLITREWAGMRTLPTLLQADSSFACCFFLSFTNACSHTGPRGESEAGGKHGALGVGEV